MRLTLALLSVVVSPAFATAQEPQPVETETFVPVTPIERANPKYPNQARLSWKEGWVVVSFVISETGEVEEPMIEDSSGVEAFEQAALEAVKGWRYAPATVNGEPVEQSMVNTRLTFALEGEEAVGATRKFQDKYRQIRRLLDAGDYAAAEPLLVEMEFGGRDNLYEDALFWALKYGYLEGVQSTDTEAKLRALYRALAVGTDLYLPPDIFVAAAQRLYVLEAQTLDFSAARRTFVRLRDSAQARKSGQYTSVVAELTPSYERIEEVIAGPQVLTIKAEIGEHDYWVHNLMRRSFSVANVSGRIDAVDIRCKRGTRRYDSFPDGAVWQVPESWGECGVYVKGASGATFTFLEHPAGTPATPLGRD